VVDRGGLGHDVEPEEPKKRKKKRKNWMLMKKKKMMRSLRKRILYRI
jgi:hypothetical protein